MDDDQVRLICRLIEEQLPQALEAAEKRLKKEIEANVMASIATRFEGIEHRVESHHSENRERFQRMASNLEQQDVMIARIEAKGDESSRVVNSSAVTLSRIEGKIDGRADVTAENAAKRDKRRDSATAWFRWVFGGGTVVTTVYQWGKAHHWF